ncbi:apolipoprotein L2-like [Colossoma macropomum]|uniref:apolipoprotein L2-like n=1 Tax=Colossoma macropomum TaxID=42526 RepID=UPI0018652CD1|nr:apolipoprotein L2-like [Colossoma macropomum]
MDESFRMSFLFHGEGQEFIDTYSECRSRMFLFLADLEETAVELDKMKTGSSISTVAGSSVGAVGGVLSIAGLALAPFTAGVSLGCTVMGVGMGVTSGVNSLVTGITEMAVNRHHGKNAKSIFQRFMEDVQKVYDCLDQAASCEHPVPNLDEGDIVFKTGKMICRVGSVGSGIDGLVEGASAIQILKSEEVARAAVNMGLQEANAVCSIPKLAADLPDIGQLAKGTPLAMTKAARMGFMAANVLFIGVDIASIYKGSESLAKGETSEASQLIRPRSALWLSEMQAWDKIYECLCEEKETFQRNLEILQQPLIVVE